MDSEDAPQASGTDDSKPVAKQKEGIGMDNIPDTWNEEPGETFPPDCSSSADALPCPFEGLLAGVSDCCTLEAGSTYS